MNGASVVASLPLTSPLITPSTGEAEPRRSSCVLYDTCVLYDNAYNTFCTIHILNVLNATHEWALASAQVFVSARKVELFENQHPHTFDNLDRHSHHF